MKRKVPEVYEPIQLAALGNQPEEVHVFDKVSIAALNAALAARRPLLVRGEPGVGKSQLARAAASPQMLNCPLISYTVDSNTESRDLLWTFDAVQRLAEAQVSGALSETEEQVRTRLDPENFFHPGPLWWAFDWIAAVEQAGRVGDRVPSVPSDGWEVQDGVVVLIDEIDKAESDVPNGLLEALGSGVFHPRGGQKSVRVQGQPPLVIITTNEERVLPDAFVRRCLVHDIVLPEDPEELQQLLLERGKAHFPSASEKVLHSAAELLTQDRVQTKTRPRPGQAEYLDLVRIVVELRPEDESGQGDLLNEVSKFVLQKRPANLT